MINRLTRRLKQQFKCIFLRGKSSKKTALMTEATVSDSNPINGVVANNTTTSIQAHTAKASNHYFSTAQSWADDYTTRTLTWKQRYKVLFLLMSGLTACLAIATSILAFKQHTELVIVHQSQDGSVWVEPSSQPMLPKNQAQTESEIIRYVQNRESFHAGSYDAQYALVELLSNSSVSTEYANSQSQSNPSSPINTLGVHGIRRVHIDNVVFLDKVTATSEKSKTKNKGRAYPHRNLAQVNFSVTERQNDISATTTIPMTALIFWDYTGTPDNPTARWQNWDGFQVTRYTTTQRNLTVHASTNNTLTNNRSTK